MGASGSCTSAAGACTVSGGNTITVVMSATQNAEFTVVAPTVRNPQSTATSSPLTISSVYVYADSNEYDADKSTSVTVTPTDYGDITSPVLSRSENTITLPTNINFKATALNEIPTGSIIKFLLTMDMFDLPGAGMAGITFKATDGAGNIGSTITYTNPSNTTTHWLFQMTSWCTGNPCPGGGDSLNFIV